MKRLLFTAILFISLFILIACTGTKPKDNKPSKGTPPIKPVKSRKNMILIKAGWFQMSTSSIEEKKRRVYVKDFFIDVYEVSNKDYARFILAGGYSNRSYWSDAGWKWREENGVCCPRWWKAGRYNVGPKFPNYPVAGVSWYEAEAYAKWVGKRLPTEAEWEKASRGEDGKRFPWGNDDIHYEKIYYANFEPVQDGYMYSCPVNEFPQGKSPYGCYNMLGNVWEWVSDWSCNREYYLKKMPSRNPIGSPDGREKILRGGSWYKDASYYESFFRYPAPPTARQFDDVGFRCAADVE